MDERRAQLETQLTAYLDGELTPEQRAEIESWLASDADARKLLAELRSLSGALRGLPRARASSDLLENVRARLERDALLGDPQPAARASRGLSSAGKWAAAAAIVLMTGTAGYVTWWRSMHETSSQSATILAEGPHRDKIMALERGIQPSVGGGESLVEHNSEDASKRKGVDGVDSFTVSGTKAGEVALVQPAPVASLTPNRPTEVSREEARRDETGRDVVIGDEYSSTAPAGQTRVQVLALGNVPVLGDVPAARSRAAAPNASVEVSERQTPALAVSPSPAPAAEVAVAAKDVTHGKAAMYDDADGDGLADTSGGRHSYPAVASLELKFPDAGSRQRALRAVRRQAVAVVPVLNPKESALPASSSVLARREEPATPVPPAKAFGGAHFEAARKATTADTAVQEYEVVVADERTRDLLLRHLGERRTDSLEFYFQAATTQNVTSAMGGYLTRRLGRPADVSDQEHSLFFGLPSDGEQSASAPSGGFGSSQSVSMYQPQPHVFHDGRPAAFSSAIVADVLPESGTRVRGYTGGDKAAGQEDAITSQPAESTVTGGSHAISAPADDYSLLLHIRVDPSATQPASQPG